LGGGVLGDLGGFAAATYLRGLSFVHIGTTLVAQVDSSIGGKLGVDLPEGKNLVGVFRQPKAVLSHVPFLKTLPKREVLGGLGEVLKYAVISDPTLLDLVLPRREAILKGDEDIFYEIVRRSSAIKARVVSADEKESSLRMILNFGHTFGHAIERLMNYRKYLHGEAIGIGMVIAARLSDTLGFCSTGDAKIVIQAVRQVGLPTETPRFTDAQWIRALEVDKKSRGGKIHFVFMKKIGDVAVQPFAAADLVKEMKKC
jgi:3-dehydroquinate synthase